MASPPGQSRSAVRKGQWWGVLALFCGALVLGFLGVATELVSCVVAANAVWASVLLATEPPVVRRVPNLRGAILMTGFVIALGLTLFAFNTGHPGAHAHAAEPPVSSP